MGMLGTWELLIILVIVILIFGVGRISKIGGELGKGIRSFREGVREGREEQEDTTTTDEPKKTDI
jgi:sec-independent protein translocase protein TatA